MSRRLGWRWPLYLGIALGLMAVAAPRTSLNPRSLLPDMVRGTAWRPYVKRALVGVMVRAADSVIPARARDALRDRVESTPLLRERLGWEPAHATWFALVFLIHLVSLMIFAAALARWLALSLELGPVPAILVAAAGLALLPLHFGYQNFIYDFPGLALFTLGLVFLWERRWTAFYVLWPLGILNKETFVLLACVFFVREWRVMARGVLVRHLAAQAAVTLAVALTLGWVFRANPGPPLEWHLMRNLSLRPPPRQLVHDAVYWGFVAFAFFGWKEKRPLAGATLAVGGVLLATTLFFGFLGEYRDFYEAWPLLAAMAVHSARSGWARVRRAAA